jgi:outer membrane protein OmpA-like peptidoglycan-associated protein
MAVILCFPCFTYAQILKDISNRIKQKTEQRANQKIDQGIDKGLDKVDNASKDATKKKDSSATTNNNNKSSDSKQNSSDSKQSNATSNSTSTSDTNSQVSKNADEAGFKTYSKFDFVPGDKVIAYDDFAQDAIGDFPVAWNTNSSGEVVTSTGQQGHWLMVRKPGRYIPEYIKDLPDNFTFEYDVVCNEKFSFYSPALSIFFLTGKNGKEALEYSFIPLDKRSGVKVGVHPANAGSTGGIVYAESFEDGNSVIKNQVNTAQFNSNTGKTKLHVAVWRQKQRLRVYVNEEKAYDLPRAFPADKTYSTVLFELWGEMNNDNDRYIFGNIKLSVGSPDTRNKLITEGKFVTRGILFDVNSDKIRPESYGVMKDIANVLAENSSVRAKIIGHTDSDGNDADNLTLSKRRAASVKESLVKDFNIDAARLETDGKGESQPVDKNTTAEGKANNRRVEFIKL